MKHALHGAMPSLGNTNSTANVAKFSLTGAKIDHGAAAANFAS